jgi:hypothetical protein
MSTIITRNSANSGSTPTSLVQGELAINVTDGRLFYGSGSENVVKEFTGSASGGTAIDTGSFVTTSSFNAYTGSNTSQFAGTASYATQALSASWAPASNPFPFNGDAQISGSLTVSGSSTLRNIGPAEFSGSFVVQGAIIPGSPPMIPDIGPYDAIKVDDVNYVRMLYGNPNQGASASVDFGNRTLYDNNAMDTIAWGGTGGEFSTFKYNAQQISATTRDSLYTSNRQGGQFLNESYFDINVVDNDLVYLGNTGEWFQVDQSTDSSTRMLGIAKNVNSQTGSVLIEGDLVVSTGPGAYPVVANAEYSQPVYIKEGAGTTMDTTVPVNGYVRLLGYCYASYNGGTDWLMKFRPSNEWIEL